MIAALAGAVVVSAADVALAWRPAIAPAMDRPGQPFLGIGEAGQGPIAAAITNALPNATGLPLSPARVKSAIGV